MTVPQCTPERAACALEKKKKGKISDFLGKTVLIYKKRQHVVRARAAEAQVFWPRVSANALPALSNDEH